MSNILIMKRSDLKRIIKEELIKVLTEEDIHWSAINFKKEITPPWAEKKEGEKADQAKERMKKELKNIHGDLIGKYLDKKDMDDAYSAFKDDEELKKVYPELRNKIMNSLARFFYYSSNLDQK